MIRKEEMILEYQPYLDHVPVKPNDLFHKATESDEATINCWRETWLKNVRNNHKEFGPFSDKSIGRFYNQNKGKPCIIIGSGPSLRNNIKNLSDRRDITTVSCLHNYHYLEDHGVPADFYITLDAQEVVIEEVFEGGKKSEEEYWESTKGKKLIAYIGSPTNLLKKWKGEIYFFNAPIPDDQIIKEMDSIEKFNVFISNGGNVLGACLYFAKSFLGSPVIAFLGADFCFSYDRKFHAWDSKYDAKMGHTLLAVDVFGNSVKTWQSYHNFKGWFEYVTMAIPGLYFNCSEGGTLGAYQGGNLRSITQMTLKDFIRMINLNEEIEVQALDPKVDEKKLLF